MASCLISVTGTSGTVLIKYKIGTNQYSIIGNIGDPLFIDDSATDITYTTLSGDAIASSLCITITNLPETCYLFEWISPLYLGEEFILESIYELTGIIIEGTTYTITPTNLSVFSGAKFIPDEINILGLSFASVTGYKQTQTDTDITFSFILKVIGNDIPQLILENPLGGNSLLMNGIVAIDCLPIDYTPVNPCSTDLIFAP